MSAETGPAQQTTKSESTETELIAAIHWHSLTLMPFNLPNILTWMRILAIPLFVGIFLFPSDLVIPLRSEPDRHHYFYRRSHY